MDVVFYYYVIFTMQSIIFLMTCLLSEGEVLKMYNPKWNGRGILGDATLLVTLHVVSFSSAHHVSLGLNGGLVIAVK